MIFIGVIDENEIKEYQYIYKTVVVENRIRQLAQEARLHD